MPLHKFYFSTVLNKILWFHVHAAIYDTDYTGHFINACVLKANVFMGLPQHTWLLFNHPNCCDTTFTGCMPYLSQNQ